MSEKLYPISEIFTSPQGEGEYTGCMMTFIRLAGCTVGKPFSKDHYTVLPQPERCSTDCDPDIGHKPECVVSAYFKSKENVLPIYREKCTLYDGREFACDTDYRVHERLSIHQIMERVPTGVEHICVSGGEPFIHNLRPFYIQRPSHTALHIETSGTIPFEKAFNTLQPMHDFWVTVSPKLGVLDEMIKIADEIKLLIDENFNVNTVPISVIDHPLVYIQPVNDEHSVRVDNLKRVMDLQKQFPHWRVSLQLHKVLSHFLNERVR